MSHMKELFFLGEKLSKRKSENEVFRLVTNKIPVLESCNKGAAVVPRLCVRFPSSCKAHTSICWLAATSAEPSRVSKLPSLITASDRSRTIN